MKKQKALKLEPVLIDRVLIQAKKEKRSFNNMVEVCIETYLEKTKMPKKK